MAKITKELAKWYRQTGVRNDRRTGWIEMYVGWHDRDSRWGGSKRYARIDEHDLRFLVKLAGLHIHRPDKGTGVVVINQSKTRHMRRLTPAEKKQLKAASAE